MDVEMFGTYMPSSTLSCVGYGLWMPTWLTNGSGRLTLLGTNLGTLEEMADTTTLSKLLDNASLPLHDMVVEKQSTFAKRINLLCQLTHCVTRDTSKSFLPATIRLYNASRWTLAVLEEKRSGHLNHYSTSAVPLRTHIFNCVDSLLCFYCLCTVCTWVCCTLIKLSIHVYSHSSVPDNCLVLHQLWIL